MRNEPRRNEIPKTDGNGHEYRDTKSSSNTENSCQENSLLINGNRISLAAFYILMF